MIPLSNLRGSRMARADVCSLPLAMHSPTIIVFAGRGRGKLSVTRGFFYVEKHLGLVLLSVIFSIQYKRYNNK